MKTLVAMLLLTQFAANPATADSKIFIIASQSVGHGLENCRASDSRCGGTAALSYCQARDFSTATAFRQVDPDDITGAGYSDGTRLCSNGVCREYVAITCQR